MTFEPPVGAEPTSDPHTVTLETNQAGRHAHEEAGEPSARWELDWSLDPSA